MNGDEWVEKGCLDRVDIAFAHAVAQDAEWHPFCIHLFRAARRGHVCCEITQEGIFPDPSELWDCEEGQQIDWEPIRKQIWEIAAKIPEGKSLFFVRRQTRYYLEKLDAYETLCLTHLTRLLSMPPRIPVDPLLLEERLGSLALTEEQKQAIRKSAKQALLVLTGGPGTGKTFTAGYLLSTLVQCMAEGNSLSIAVAAPTGKAALQLEQSLCNAATLLPPLRAETLHRLLKIGSLRRWDESCETLSADIVLVDESSMIDLPMMARLFAAVQRGARLILLGDPEQLPPVEVGQSFRDLVAALRTLPDPPLIALTTCLRAENRALIAFAEHIRSSAPDILLEELMRGTGEVAFHPVKAFSSLARDWKERLIALFQMPKTPQEAVRQLPRFRILSPLRKGIGGVEMWNRLLAQEYPTTFPILLTKTEETLALPNGLLGVLWEDRAFFPSRSLAASLLPPFEKAFCLSVHKSQGSEFDHVVLFLPPGSERFAKEMLYTAATRAKRRLDIVTTKEILLASLKKANHRISGLSIRIRENL